MKRRIIRDAITGLFTSKARLESDPDTTVAEVRYSRRVIFRRLEDLCERWEDLDQVRPARELRALIEELKSE